MKTQKIIKYLTLIILISFETLCSAQNGKDTLKVLFVGNSYTFYGNLAQIVSIMSDSTSKKLITKKSIAPGVKLSEHWNGARGLKTRELIEKGNFDMVVLQDQSMEAINEPDTLYKYVNLFSDLIRKNNGKPFLYMTWAREKNPEQQETISRVYRTAAQKSNAIVVPVGEAWVLAKQLAPDYQLYWRDGSHPSIYGTVLTACVFVSYLNNEVPVHLPTFYNSIDRYNEFIFFIDPDRKFLATCLDVAKGVMVK